MLMTEIVGVDMPLHVDARTRVDFILPAFIRSPTMDMEIDLLHISFISLEPQWQSTLVSPRQCSKHVIVNPFADMRSAHVDKLPGSIDPGGEFHC
jgi:hypothetical protein